MFGLLNPTTEVLRLQYHQWSRNDIRWTLCQCVFLYDSLSDGSFHSVPLHSPPQAGNLYNWCDERVSTNCVYSDSSRCVVLYCAAWIVLALCSYREVGNIKIWDFFVLLFVVIFFVIVTLFMNSDNVTLTSLPRLYMSARVQHKLTKCTFPKLIFKYWFSGIVYMFLTPGFIFRKTVVYTIAVWYVLHATDTGSFPGVKCGRGVLLTTHSLLVPRSWKSRAIPLPTLWATPSQ